MIANSVAVDDSDAGACAWQKNAVTSMFVGANVGAKITPNLIN